MASTSRASRKTVEDVEMCVLWTLSSYMTWQIIPHLQHTERGRWPSDGSLCVSWLVHSRLASVQAGREVCPSELHPLTFFHTLQKISGRVKVCALCSEKKNKTPPGRGKETKYKCKQCDLPLCPVGCFWNTTSSKMWRCKISWVGYYMHTFITNKLKKSYHSVFFSLIVMIFFPGGETCFWCST